jgi:hypothetical protein
MQFGSYHWNIIQESAEKFILFNYDTFERKPFKFLEGERIKSMNKTFYEPKTSFYNPDTESFYGKPTSENPEKQMNDCYVWHRCQPNEKIKQEQEKV